jgi:hypothetical protein
MPVLRARQRRPPPTALAWQAARTTVARGWFPGGTLVVDLHGDDSDPAAQVAPERVYASLLRALDPSLPVADLPATVEEQASAYHHLMSHLDQLSRPVLLVLENAGNTDQVTGLLPAGRAHRVLITSRHTLGELPGARLREVDVLASEFAVELLGARRPGDPRLGADPAAAVELARLCGHLPLALQIIAVLMADDPARPTADLVKELAEETTRLQGLPSQRWAGRAALELSYRHLERHRGPAVSSADDGAWRRRGGPGGGRPSRSVRRAGPPGPDRAGEGAPAGVPPARAVAHARPTPLARYGTRHRPRPARRSGSGDRAAAGPLP